MWPFPTRRKSLTQPDDRGWRRIVGEPWTGAWQSGQTEITQADLLSYPAVHACITRIADDVGNLPFHLMQRDSAGTPQRVLSASVLGRLARPNGYQTPAQFRAAWMLSKLIYGNALILHEGGELHVIDWTRVTVLVSDSGAVFYRVALSGDNTLLPERFRGGTVTLPASAVMHDRAATLYSPLVGVPPLSAATLAAQKNDRILHAANDLFARGAEMGGLVSVPAGMSADDTKAMRDYWSKTSASDVRVIGADAKFTPFTAKASDSQLVEQLKYSDRQVCQAFRVPPSLVGIEELPAGLKIGDQMRMYYRLCLQSHVQAIETHLTRALVGAPGQWITLDTSQLLRMDPTERASVWGGLVGDGIATTNEARAQFDLPPVTGGDVVFRQQQDIPLDSPGGTPNGNP